MKMDQDKRGKTIKATVGMGIALSAIMLSVSVDNVKADEIQVPPTTTVVQEQQSESQKPAENTATTDSTVPADNTSSTEKTVPAGNDTVKNEAETDKGVTVQNNGETDAQQNKGAEKNDASNTDTTPSDKETQKQEKKSAENQNEPKQEDSSKDKQNLQKQDENAVTDSVINPAGNMILAAEPQAVPTQENKKVLGIYLTNDLGEKVLYELKDSDGITDVNSSEAYFRAIKEAFTNEEYTGLEIYKDITINTDRKNLIYENRDNKRDLFTFTIKEGKTLTMNQTLSKEVIKAEFLNPIAIEVRMGEGKFNLVNNGKFIMNDYKHPITVSGGKDSVFTMSGNYDNKNDKSAAYANSEDALVNGTTFINRNMGYAIDANQGGGFSGTFNFKDTKLITDSTGPEGDASNAKEVNGESAVYIGSNKDVRLNIENSRLDLRNNDVGGTASAFMSNAGVININDSIINSSSRAHYNFNPHTAESDDEKKNTVTNNQKVTFNNSELHLNTPKDSNPYTEKKIFGFTIKVKRDSVGVNSANTTFTFNNSKLTHNTNGYSKTQISTVELSQSRLVSNNSELDIPHLGFDYDNKYDPNTPIKHGESRANPGIEINGESKVTIDKINPLMTEKYAKIPIDDTIKEIVINGGSVKLPMKNGTNIPALPTQDGKTTKVVNSDGVELTHFVIPPKNVREEYFNKEKMKENLI